MNSRTFVGLLIAALTALAASCGGGDDAAPASLTPSAPPVSPPSTDQVRITFYGHSMFTIESPGGVKVLTDPNQGIGYAAPSDEIDVVTVSHEHFDHNKVEVAPNARVLRGLEDDDWAHIDETIGDVRIQTTGTFHDDVLGAERGKNAVFAFEVAGLRIVHLGDMGHPSNQLALEDDQLLTAFFDVALSADVLLIPMGGHFTIGPEEADAAIDGLDPTLVIPMHFRTDFLHDVPEADELATVDDFTAGKVDVQRPRQSAVTLEAGAVPAGILVLEPQPE